MTTVPMGSNWTRAEGEGLVVAWGWVVVMGLGGAACRKGKAWRVVVQGLESVPHQSPRTSAMVPLKPPWAMPACSIMPGVAFISPITGCMIRDWGGG